MKVLVTGSSGFIGRRLVERLLRDNHEVIGCDIKPSNLTNEKFRHFTVDFTIMNELLPLFKMTKPDVCYHVGAIANINFAREHPLETVNVNVMGTAVVAEACRRFGTLMNYISTCCVYGNTNVHPTPESAPTYPTEIYGCTKLAAEYVVKGFHKLYNLNYNILRPSTVYGEGMRPALAVYIFLNKALKGEKIPIHGTGKQTRSFIYIDDLVEGLVKLLQADVVNQTINLAGRQEVSVLQLARKCLRLAGRNTDDLEFVADRKGQVMKEQIDISKAKKLLDWETIAKFMDKIYSTKSFVTCRKSCDPFDVTTYGKAYNESAKRYILRNLWIARRYHIIHVHSFDWIVPLLKMLYPTKPVLLHYHGTDIRGKWRDRKKFWRWADVILVSTEDLLKYAPDRAIYLPNPVDTELFSLLNLRRKSKALLMVKHGRSHMWRFIQPLAEKVSNETGIPYELWFCDKHPVPYIKMPFLLNKYEYFYDFPHGHTERDKILPVRSLTGLQALACGLKVINWEGKIIHPPLPPQHHPTTVCNQIYKIYRELI